MSYATRLTSNNVDRGKNGCRRKHNFTKLWRSLEKGNADNLYLNSNSIRGHDIYYIYLIYLYIFLRTKLYRDKVKILECPNINLIHCNWKYQQVPRFYSKVIRREISL